MTVDEFRSIALSFPETEERAHMNHPDFRVGGKIFATLSYPNESFGMVKLFPDQQAEFVAGDPNGAAGTFTATVDGTPAGPAPRMSGTTRRLHRPRPRLPSGTT